MGGGICYSSPLLGSPGVPEFDVVDKGVGGLGVSDCSFGFSGFGVSGCSGGDAVTS